MVFASKEMNDSGPIRCVEKCEMKNRNVPWGNRTLNCPLGGGCYIHLTKETKYCRDSLTTVLNYTICIAKVQSILPS